jgi:hypothetical protein
VVLQAVAVYVLLLPLVLIGYAVNLPPALLLSGIARAVGKEESMASIKLGGGIVLFPPPLPFPSALPLPLPLPLLSSPLQP